ncbi:MAG: histidinol-phosphate transaminase [Candidatus Lokiarchaeota archaeon]|jgi:histidinol-phosphate aminotransferase|nr:histidinol-phosphate transaminase [Candidatus Lokiarchaeota archaeon]
MEIEKLFRENLQKYNSYETEEQPEDEGWLKLNINENAYPPVQEILEDIKSALESEDLLRKYPDPFALELRKAILNQLLRDKNTLTNRNTVFIGNGSDDVLDVIFKVFVNPGDEVVVFYPTFSLYKVLANLYDAKINEIKLKDDFSIPESVYDQKGKLLFINSPNDPNGKSFDNDTILKICYHFPGIVVVDEEYADFSDYTCLPLLKDVNNLIVCRSFSKTFSIASLRIGYALTDAIIVKEMNRVKLPFNTNHIAQLAAISCIKHRNKIYDQNKKIIAERKRLSEKLDIYDGINVLPSDANFIFIKFDDKSTTLKFLWDLKDIKILVRHFSKPGLYNYIRVTIGTKEENDKFLEGFNSIAEKYL